MKELKIKINKGNTGKIEDAIKAAEGRATARTINAGWIMNSVERVEDALNIPKTHMKGIRVDVDPHAQSFPRAYKYTPESTQFSAEYNGKEWVLTGIWRGACHGCTQEFSITLTDEAKAAIIKSFETGTRI